MSRWSLVSLIPTNELSMLLLPQHMIMSGYGLLRGYGTETYDLVRTINHEQCISRSTAGCCGIN